MMAIQNGRQVSHLPMLRTGVSGSFVPPLVSTMAFGAQMTSDWDIGMLATKRMSRCRSVAILSGTEAAHHNVLPPQQQHPVSFKTLFTNPALRGTLHQNCEIG